MSSLITDSGVVEDCFYDQDPIIQHLQNYIAVKYEKDYELASGQTYREYKKSQGREEAY